MGLIKVFKKNRALPLILLIGVFLAACSQNDTHKSKNTSATKKIVTLSKVHAYQAGVDKIILKEPNASPDGGCQRDPDCFLAYQKGIQAGFNLEN